MDDAFWSVIPIGCSERLVHNLLARAGYSDLNVYAVQTRPTDTLAIGPGLAHLSRVRSFTLSCRSYRDISEPLRALAAPWPVATLLRELVISPGSTDVRILFVMTSILPGSLHSSISPSTSLVLGASRVGRPAGCDYLGCGLAA
jgi:hypothetical protein